MKKNSMSLTICAVILLLCCTSANGKKESNPASVLEWSFAQHMDTYIQARMAHSRGDNKKALALYKEILDSQGSIYAYDGYLRLLQDTGNYEEIVRLIPKLDEPFKEDPDLQLIFSIALKKTGKQNEGNSRIISLSRRFSQNHDIVFHAVHAFLNLKEPENAINTIDALLSNASKQPNSHLFQFLKAQVHIQTHDYDKALTELDATLEKNPYFDRALLLRALIKEQQGEVHEAKKGFEAYLDVTGSTDTSIKQHLRELDNKLNKRSEPEDTSLFGAKKARIVMTDPSSFEKSTKAFKRKHHRQALGYIEHYLEQNPRDVNAKLFKVQIYAAMHKDDEAIQTLSTWIHEEPNIEIWHQTLHLLSYTGTPRHKVIAAFEEMHKQYPKNMLVIMYLANLYIRSHEPNSAITCLEAAYTACNDDHLKSKILFQIGSMRYQQGSYENLEEVTQRAEKLPHSFAPLHNLSAYYHATIGNNLKKAQEYVKKANTLSPNNPHIADTIGVILYKQAHYDKARTLFEKIEKREPHDATILIHLAKTYHKLGDQKLALETIKKATTFAHSSYEKSTVHDLQTAWKNKKKR